MNPIPIGLMDAARQARNGLNAAAHLASRANLGRPDSPSSPSAMAAVAEQAVFADALLAAMRSHLEEFKSATR